MTELERFADEYLSYLEQRRYSPETVRKTGYLLKGAVSRLGTHGAFSPERLRATHLRRWTEYVCSRTWGPAGRPLSAATVNRHITVMRGWLKWLAKTGKIPRRLADVPEHVREPQLLPGSVLTHLQVRKLLDSIPTDSSLEYRNRTMLELLYSTGIRASELLGLHVGDMQPEQKVIKVLGKGSKERMVPVGKTAARFLAGYLKAVRPFLCGDTLERALFVGLEGRRMSYPALLRMVHTVARRAGVAINVTPHTFRRSCATELLRGGANMYHVKELLGHETLDTLKHYARLTITDLKRTHAKCHPRERERNT